MGRTLVGLAVLLCGALAAGCASESTTSPPESTTAAPVSPPTQASPAPAVSATPPTKAEAGADLAQALVTAKDLGKPWVQPKAVSQVKGKKGEVCPGHVSATVDVPTLAETGANLTEGKGAGKNIGSFSLSMLPGEDDAALIAAYATDQKACASFKDGNGMFVVRSAEGAEAVEGAEPVAAWAERIYYDKGHKKLAYARHYLVVRQGSVVTYVSYAFLTTKSDPKAKDFTRTSKLARKQLDKNATVFS